MWLWACQKQSQGKLCCRPGLVRRAHARVRSDVALGLPKAIIRKALHVALGLQRITRKALLPAKPRKPPESTDFFIKGLLKNAISQVLRGYPLSVAYSTIKEGSCEGLIRSARPRRAVANGSGFAKSNHKASSACGSGFARSNHKESSVAGRTAEVSRKQGFFYQGPFKECDFTSSARLSPFSGLLHN